MEHVPIGITEGKKWHEYGEFVPANFPKHNPHEMKIEAEQGYVPDRWLTTAQMMDGL